MLKKLKIFTLVLLTFTTFTLLFLNYGPPSLLRMFEQQEAATDLKTEKCSFINMDGSGEEVGKFFKKLPYQSCSKGNLLSYTTKSKRGVILHLNRSLLKGYENVNCLVQKIVRFKKSDKKISLVHRFPLIKEVNLDENPVKIACFRKNRTIYQNVHAPVVVTNDIRNKMEKSKIREALNVLVVGIDGVSRLNFIRALPKTYQFLRENQWLEFSLYNKIGDNTYPNVMAMLTGHDQFGEMRCAAETSGLDDCPMIWYDYRKLGYITAHAEDEVTISTFNLGKKGFRHPPTDYYFRPYFIAAEKKLKLKTINQLAYCSGPETTGERMLNLIKDFSTTFRNYPTFSFFWMNSFSHNTLSLVSMFDEKILEFWRNLTRDGTLNKTVIFFLSDHGLRVSKARATLSGWFEDRLPFFFMWVPTAFRKKFPQEFDFARNNTLKLTSPYNVYMTLQHLLVLSGLNYEIKKSRDCSKCKSLFEEIQVRTCSDAGVPLNWCSCLNLKLIDKNSTLVRNSTNFLIEQINKIIIERKVEGKCAMFSLTEIIASHILEQQKILIIRLEANPKAVFEGYVHYGKSSNFKVFGTINRIDKYAPHSHCVANDTSLQKFCYCQKPK